MRRLALAVLLVLASGCSGGPPKIAAGTPCVHCGMSVAELRFACVRQVDGEHTYDSIECLLAEADANDRDWLSDYDTRTLHPADSMWVVHGTFPSPMGGGYAAFLDRKAADDVAQRTQGRVARFAEWRARQ